MANWKEVLGKLAPTAATLLGGPFAGLAVGAVVKALGLPEGSTEEQIQATVNNGLTGEQLLALRLAEIDVQKHLQDNGIELEKIASNDRDSARKREIEIKDNTPKVLAYLVTLGFFGTLTALMTGQVNTVGHDVLLVMVGSLGTAWTGIIAYYFGSSAGSKEKTNLLAKAPAIT
jgi:hypothetical protein